MANEIRVRSAVLAGTTTDNPLLIGAATLNSARLADVPAIGATEFYPIILDPLGVNGAPEVVWITAHTASATSATIVRAREGTAARQHASGTTWYHAPTVNDYVRVVTSAPSGTGLPFDGQPWYHQSEKRLYLSEAGAGVRIGHTTSAGRTGGTWTRSGNQSINNGTETAITFTAESFDSDGFLTPTSGSVTIPSGLGGIYAFDVAYTWETSVPTLGAQGVRVGSTPRITLNGLGSYSGSTRVGYSGTIVVAAGDVVTFFTVQNNGSSKNITEATLNFYRLGV